MGMKVNGRLWVSSAMVAVVATGIVLLSGPGPAVAEEIAVGDLPDAVVNAINERFADARIQEAEREVEDGEVIYEVEVVSGGTEYDVEVTAAGQILEVEAEDDDDEDDDGEDEGDAEDDGDEDDEGEDEDDDEDDDEEDD